ncbi:hypothetical protein ACHAWF_003413, partial [Thalassiosira exigua]
YLFPLRTLGHLVPKRLAVEVESFVRPKLRSTMETERRRRQMQMQQQRRQRKQRQRRRGGQPGRRALFCSSLAFLSPRRASSFAPPRATRATSLRPLDVSRSTFCEWSKDVAVNGTDWAWDERDATAFERELLEGYVAHEYLLDSMGGSASKTELVRDAPASELAFAAGLESVPTAEEGLTSALDEPLESGSVQRAGAGPKSVAPKSTSRAPAAPFLALPALSDVWKARLLLLLSAALYGTNFTMVKSLDESMSVGLSSTLRFGFAALAMSPWLFRPLDEELKAASKSANTEKISGTSRRQKKGHAEDWRTDLGEGWKKFMEEPTRLSAGLVGMEIGAYNSIGYIAQAAGLKTTTASKSAFICRCVLQNQVFLGRALCFVFFVCRC